MEFSHLHFDTSFSSIDNKSSTFDTDLWKLCRSKSYKMKKNITRGLFEERCHTYRNWITLAELTGHGAVNNPRKFEWARYCGAIGSITVICTLCDFLLAWFSNLNFSDSVIFPISVLNVDNDLWRKMNYQHDDKIQQKSECVNYITIMLQLPDLKLWPLIWVQSFFVWSVYILSVWTYTCRFHVSNGNNTINQDG